jgi:hypothetical protein
MNQDNSKGPGSDLKFVWWDDIGDSQEHVDKQCSCDGWKKEIQEKELGGCCNHAKQQEEDEAELRMMIIMRNGNEGSHYPEHQDYMDDSDDE